MNWFSESSFVSNNECFHEEEVAIPTTVALGKLYSTLLASSLYAKL